MTSSNRYSLAALQDKVRQLVQQGVVSRQQPISILHQYIPPREWIWIERGLEENDFLLRDRIGDLLNHEEWGND